MDTPIMIKMIKICSWKIHWLTCFPKKLLREKCPDTELFLVRIFLYSDWIREIWTRKKMCIWKLFTQWVCQNYAQFELRWAPDSVINIFSKWDRCILVVIINDYKTVWGNLEILFLSQVLFNNVHEKAKYNSFQN